MEELIMVYVGMIGWLVSKTLVVPKEIELEKALSIYLGKNFNWVLFVRLTLKLQVF